MEKIQASHIQTIVHLTLASKKSVYSDLSSEKYRSNSLATQAYVNLSSMINVIADVEITPKW